MAKPELSPPTGRFSLPNPLPTNHLEWLQSNFELRQMKLPRLPNCVSFRRTDLEGLCKNPALTDLSFSKVSLNKKNNSGQETTLGVAGARGTMPQLNSADKIFFGNRFLAPVLDNFDASIRIGTAITIPLGKPLKSSEIKMPETSGKPFNILMNDLQDFESFPDLNYCLTVSFVVNDFDHFWELDDCASVVFYPIMMEFDLMRQTKDAPPLVLTDFYSTRTETLLAAAADSDGNLLSEGSPVISPNAWPPRYIRSA